MCLPATGPLSPGRSLTTDWLTPLLTDLLTLYCIIKTEANSSATASLALFSGAIIVTIFHHLHTDNLCPPPLALLSETSQLSRDGRSNSPLPSPHHHAARLRFNHPRPRLYIHAWKSFAINQNLYIQNRKPFVINKSSWIPKGCLSAPQPTRASDISVCIYTPASPLPSTNMCIYRTARHLLSTNRGVCQRRGQ